MQDSNHWPLFLVKRFHENKYNIPHTEKLTCYVRSEFQIGETVQALLKMLRAWM
jgi:hypothetical protein